mmetsp:Transcript_22384/g.48696  ORF Transcript_22384/g.48696 Transcript_22384/m.48696 type:complete len:671 (-) Transcript_22384:176-2188(-)|eukprot:CAMPEP_0168739626 /NCGR_PEP_ID=MMETSP0724-20121128/11560_1 /TAXON_ID=265536 /ORGANISM="Amphiprora sp., Strain CCMP467" /LENGTH=670 /DNA_ID=CAMNT_0008787035 /DNA_START=28 /DNA_END=2040 /DNA_ORIENTATION=-
MNCGPVQQTMDETPRPMLRDRSEFGDNRSLGESHNPSIHGSLALPSNYHDEPEADYDKGATGLYRCIEGKDWDGALSRLELAPIEAKTWVSRREHGKDKIRWRLLPLHAVCIFRAPLALIEAIIEVYADGPKMKDDQGMLPVHLACRNGASKGVVLTLLSAFPDSINIRDRKNRLPVDLVEASNSQNKENVLSAIKKFQRDMIKMNVLASQVSSQGSSQLSLQESVGVPNNMTQGSSQNSHKSPVASIAPREIVDISEPAKEVDYEHRTILFRMILKKDWKQASGRARAVPEEAATWIVTKGFNGNLRFLPLHKACVLQPPSTIVESLLEAFPGAAQSKDQDGWLPIHCACFYGADADVVNNLLKVYARGSGEKDEEGRLPLHYACLKGASQEVVDVLIATSSKAAMAKDDEGRLPIHHACGKSAPEGVIDALLKAAPKGAQSKDDQGRLPLHHACRKNVSERVIRTLLRVYPRAAQIKDDQDKLAIHYACQNGGSPAIVHLLLTTYPESINVKNGFGFTPLGEVKSANNPKMEPVLKLLEKFKESHDKTALANGAGDLGDAEGRIHILQDKVAYLETSLTKIGDIGRDIKAELRRGRDAEEVLEDLADRLLLLGKVSNNTRNSTPLKTKQGTPGKGRSATSAGRGRRISTGKKRSTTPSRGLFGRKKVS